MQIHRGLQDSKRGTIGMIFTMLANAWESENKEWTFNQFAIMSFMEFAFYLLMSLIIVWAQK